MSALVHDQDVACKQVQGLLWTNFAISAGWRKARVQHELYLRTTHGDQLTPWAEHPGFNSKRSLFDSMHVMQLGTDRCFIASVLLHLCGYTAFAVLDALLRVLYVEMQDYCKAICVCTCPRAHACVCVCVRVCMLTWPEALIRRPPTHAFDMCTCKMQYWVDLWSVFRF